MILFFRIPQNIGSIHEQGMSLLIEVTSLKASDHYVLNDDDNKPQSWKISKDNQGDRFFINWSTRLNGNREELERIIDWLIEKTTIRLQGKSIPTYRLLCEVILLNLSKSLLQRRWVQIPKSTAAYSKGTVPHQLGFSRRHVIDVLEILYDSEAVYEVTGAKYTDDPQLSSFQPTEYFDTQLVIDALGLEQSFDIDPVRVNGQEGLLTEREQIEFDQDVKDLTIINNFLKQHSYPLKGPMTRIYTKNVGAAGRIYCDFQALSKRQIPIRQTSLIDGEPIAEIDIIASHPRMAIQKFHDQKIANTFYQDVADELDIFRDKIKKFFQVALSSSSREKARGGFKKGTNYDLHDFNAIENWMKTNYPLVPLYQSLSMSFMNHEGTILKAVMLKGVEEGIVVLPIHDAIAVRQSDSQWGEEALKAAWKNLFGTDCCEVKVETY